MFCLCTCVVFSDDFDKRISSLSSNNNIDRQWCCDNKDKIIERLNAEFDNICCNTEMLKPDNFQSLFRLSIKFDNVLKYIDSDDIRQKLDVITWYISTLYF